MISSIVISNGMCSFFNHSFLIVIAVIQSLPIDGGMVEDHGVPEAVQLSRAWIRGRKETESRQTASGAKSP